MDNVIETRDLGRREGFDLVAYKVADIDSTPYDADCYDSEDIAAWRRDEWSYVGVIVTASYEGITLGEASLWACEDGSMPQVDRYVDAFDHTLGEHEHDYDIPYDAITDARNSLTRLSDIRHLVDPRAGLK